MMPAPTRPTLFRLRRHAPALARALALSMLACAGARAGDTPDLTTLPLEQLMSMEVYSASKFMQKSSRAPSSVTVITAAEIRHFGWRTLADVTRSVRGMVVSYDRNYSYLGQRGILRPGDFNTRFLLQVDGNRMNDAVYDQAPVGAEFPLDLDLIERIEFVPGPGSSIYGSNAFIGVINVITKKPGAVAGARGSLDVGQDGARQAAASVGWRSPQGSEYLIAASGHRSDGRDLYFPEFDTPAQNHGVASGLDDERGQRFFARATHGAATLSLIHANRIKGIPTASYSQSFNDPRTATTDRQTYVNAAWRSEAGAVEQLKARLFWGQYDSFGDYVAADEARTLSHDGSSARWWGIDASVVSTRLARHTVLAGIDLQRDYRLHQYSFDIAPFHSYLDDRRSARRAGLYLQDQVALGETVLLNLGLRYDRNSGSDGVWSPRAALIWNPLAATTVKAIYGSAFRSPNSFEKFYAFPGEGGQTGNPGLCEERVRSAELALVQEFGENARVSVSAFRTALSNLIAPVELQELASVRFDNIGRLGARGVEIEYERGTLGGLSLRTSYSAIRVSDALGQPVNAPASLAKLNLSAPLGAGLWRGALEGQYVGARHGVSGTARRYVVVNANLMRARLLPNLELSLGVTNLFDRAYADPASIEHRQRVIAQDGRRLRARLAYVF
ncbi:TonB-dependent receptor plug domain-containing protein [Massilia scottii]|uniref:TonB-dependent receptor plug domain-containing protein n=1 Tax=Massilia scottii TaxID=3057166 RepID=UPI002796736B|nr:TonB-dependent receptor [Massilia sp. CCM 9029]MDQ1831543.1 TonB-dependent receptor [Massilia sp. CCM 9029]